MGSTLEQAMLNVKLANDISKRYSISMKLISMMIYEYNIDLEDIEEFCEEIHENEIEVEKAWEFIVDFSSDFFLIKEIDLMKYARVAIGHLKEGDK